jgi:hypothetical protein
MSRLDLDTVLSKVPYEFPQWLTANSLASLPSLPDKAILIYAT